MNYLDHNLYRYIIFQNNLNIKLTKFISPIIINYSEIFPGEKKNII